MSNAFIKDSNSRRTYNEKNACLCFEELEALDALDENKLEVQQRLECYQAQLFEAFNKKKVRILSFQIGDMVHVARRPINFSQKIKMLEPK